MERPEGHQDPLRRESEPAAAVSGAERRQTDRREFNGAIVLIWHHRPGQVMQLSTVDVSETGARVRTTCCLPEGMTGMAIELVSSREGDWGHDREGGVDAGVVEARGRDAESPANRSGTTLSRIPIGRAVTVVWSRAIRREDGRLDHYEAGLRFF